MSEDKISDEEEDDFVPRPDRCFTCGGSQSAAEEFGFRRAITLLRDEHRLSHWMYNAGRYAGLTGSDAADYLEAQEKTP